MSSCNVFTRIPPMTPETPKVENISEYINDPLFMPKTSRQTVGRIDAIAPSHYIERQTIIKYAQLSWTAY